MDADARLGVQSLLCTRWPAPKGEVGGSVLPHRKWRTPTLFHRTRAKEDAEAFPGLADAESAPFLEDRAELANNGVSCGLPVFPSERGDITFGRFKADANEPSGCVEDWGQLPQEPRAAQKRRGLGDLGGIADERHAGVHLLRPLIVGVHGDLERTDALADVVARDDGFGLRGAVLIQHALEARNVPVHLSQTLRRAAGGIQGRDSLGHRRDHTVWIKSEGLLVPA